MTKPAGFSVLLGSFHADKWPNQDSQTLCQASLPANSWRRASTSTRHRVLWSGFRGRRQQLKTKKRRHIASRPKPQGGKLDGLCCRHGSLL